MSLLEYGFIVKTVEIRPGLADATSNEVSQMLSSGLGPLAQDISKSLLNLPPGGWRVLSHNLTRIDRHLILTFLICRES
jgi:hypothetical protein